MFWKRERKEKEILSRVELISNIQNEILKVIDDQQKAIDNLERNVQALRDQLSKKEGM